MTAPDAVAGRRALVPRGAANVAAIALLVALIVVLVLGFRRDPLDIRSALVGREAPAFVLPALDGSGTVALADLRGKVVVVNFFASWCIPCYEEHPALARAWERYRGSDVAFVGIVYDDSPESARDMVRRLGTTWPTVTDEGGRTKLRFGVLLAPETFFIAPDGTVAGRHKGAIDEETLSRGIDALRKRPS